MQADTQASIHVLRTPFAQMYQNIHFPVGSTVLPAPARLGEVQAAAFVEHCFHVLLAPRLIVDLRAIAWAEPFGTLLIACALRHVVMERRKKGLATKLFPDPSVHMLTPALSYLRSFGFFDYIFREKDTYRATLKGGVNYLPITRVSLNKIESEDEAMQESVDEYSNRLASVLFPDALGAQVMLAYCFREIIRNTFEHGEVDECLLMAQRWGLEAEIAIADSGSGIHASIAPVHGTTNPEESLRLALLPGIRGLTANVDTGRYQNSGFGLYVVSEVGSRYGQFSIQSSERLLVRRRNSPDSWTNTRAIGTCVKLRANLEDGEYFPNILTGIVKEGEQFASELPGAVANASAASKRPQLKRWKAKSRRI